MFKVSVTSRVFSFKLRLHLLIICVVSEMITRLFVYIITYDIQKKENDIKSYASKEQNVVRCSLLSLSFPFSRVLCPRLRKEQEHNARA